VRRRFKCRRGRVQRIHAISCAGSVLEEGLVSCRRVIIFDKHGRHPYEALAIHGQCHPCKCNCTPVNLSRTKSVKCMTWCLARIQTTELPTINGNFLSVFGSSADISSHVPSRVYASDNMSGAWPSCCGEIIEIICRLHLITTRRVAGHLVRQEMMHVY
jgi:hypothetical protein